MKRLTIILSACFFTVLPMLRASDLAKGSLEEGTYKKLICEKILSYYLKIENSASEKEILGLCQEKILADIDPEEFILYGIIKRKFTFTVSLPGKNLFLEGSCDINEDMGNEDDLYLDQFPYYFEKYRVVNLKIKSRKRNGDLTIRDRLANVIRSALKNELHAPARAELRWYDKTWYIEEKILEELNSELRNRENTGAQREFCTYENTSDEEVVLAWLALVDEEQEILPAITTWRRKGLPSFMYARGFFDGSGAQCHQFYFKIYFYDGWMINLLYNLSENE